MSKFFCDNTLAIASQKLTLEWNYARNNSFSPNTISSHSNQAVWWICSLGHEWKATVNARMNGTGCPYCANKKVLRGFNDLESKNPTLAAEWHPQKNKPLTPADVMYGSGKKVWWMCKEGHEWQALVSSRNNGRKCPVCTNRKVCVGYNDFATTYPELLAEWNYDKNAVMPSQITKGYDKKVWWKCVRGHEWQSTISNRRKANCPYCSGKKALKGINDLLTLNPNLVEEWNYSRNNALAPNEITIHSSKKVWWKCSKCNHEWQATVHHRTNGRGCPKCIKRKHTSFPEQAIFFYVKKSHPDAENGYVDIFPSTGMELDIYIPDAKVAIEYDGATWHKGNISTQRDAKKYQICKQEGIFLIRVKEMIGEETLNADYVCHISSPKDFKCLDEVISSLSKFICIPNDINTERDRALIWSLYYTNMGDNSFASIHPALAAEWNYQKNGTLLPHMCTPSSGDKVWWICPHGHEYEAFIYSRVAGSGCPYCANHKILSGFNDLLHNNPTLAAEWHPVKNGSTTPDQISYTSIKKVWWMCAKGHEWEARVSHRHNGSGCPYCSGRYAIPGENDLATTHPHLAKEWDHDNNNGLLPINVKAKSEKKVWWKCCVCGHHWEAAVYRRTAGSKCPACQRKNLPNE